MKGVNHKRIECLLVGTSASHCLSPPLKGDLGGCDVGDSTGVWNLYSEAGGDVPTFAGVTDTPRRSAFGIAFLLVLLFAVTVQAQRAVVVTSSLSATRQSARIYAQAVDLESGELLPGGAPLPGSNLLGTPVPGVFADEAGMPDGYIAVATGPSEPSLHPDPGYPETSISLVRPWPFLASEKRFHEAEAGWREWLADLSSGSASPGLLVLGRRAGESDAVPQVGRARILGGNADVAATTIAEWPLPGTPVTGVWMPSVTSALVLCAGQPGTAPVLVKCSLGSAQTLRLPADKLAGWNLACTDARTLTRLPGTDLCVVAFSGRPLSGASTEPVTQVYVIDSNKLTLVGGPLSARGMARRICAVDDGHLWVAADAPGTDFAYATRIQIDPASGTVTSEAE